MSDDASDARAHHDAERDSRTGPVLEETRRTSAGGPPRGAGSPLSPREIRQSLVRPDLMAAHVLGSVDRVARNLTQGESLWLLIALLSVASLVVAVPYGAFSPVSSFWKVSVLFTGSLLICLPSLHVFLQFLGFRITLVRNLSLALVITATAGLFTFGFFPVIWFIGLTTRSGVDSPVTPADLSRALLGVSLLMGIVQMIRCLGSSRLGVGDGLRFPVFAWIPLLLFIVWRMADVLGLRG